MKPLDLEAADPRRAGDRAHVARGCVAALLWIAATGCGSDEEPTGPGGGGGPLPPAEGFVQVAAGGSHSCGLLAAGEVLCWGGNVEGQLGDGNAPDTSSVPVPIESDIEFAAIAVGGAHSCALTTDGAAHCWGSDSDGQLGHGPNSIMTGVPTPVTGGHTFIALAAGDAHTCGLDTTGAAHCWGANGFGQLGDGNAPDGSSVPVPVEGDLELIAIAAGGGHTCGLDTTGAAHCWGNNGTDQLGDGSAAPSDTPVAVQGGQTFGAVIGGGVHTCALTSAGAAHCWGFNFFGQLGDGTETGRDAPTPVTGDTEFARLTAGSDHTCGVTADGAAYCWGFNGSGRLGDDSETDRSEPTPVQGGLALADVDAGSLHTCAVTVDGEAYCWGQNDTGQLGDGTTDNRFTPVEVIVP